MPNMNEIVNYDTPVFIPTKDIYRYPAFLEQKKKMEAKLVADGSKKFKKPYKGLYPDGDSFGKSTIRPELFTWTEPGSLTGEFKFTLGSGDVDTWKEIINAKVKEDVIVAIDSFQIANPTLLITQLKITAGGKELSVIDLEAAKNLEGFNIMLSETLVIMEKKSFKVEAYVVQAGTLYFVPDGLAVATDTILLSKTG